VTHTVGRAALDRGSARRRDYLTKHSQETDSKPQAGFEQPAVPANDQIIMPLISWNTGLDMIYLSTAIGLSPGGSTHLHTNNK